MSYGRRERELLGLDPEQLTDEELEEALGDGSRITRMLKADHKSTGGLRQQLQKREQALRAKVHDFRAELRDRG